MDVYNKVARDLGRPVTNELLRLSAHGLLQASDLATFERKADRLLMQAIGVGDTHPELTVKWATHVVALSCARRRSVKTHPLTTAAIEAVLEHAPGAFLVDARQMRRNLASCWCGTTSHNLQIRLEQLGGHLEPQLKASPWGMPEGGIDFLNAERERRKTVWDRLGDFKHRVLHPPHPDQVTLDR